jgi:hypothetical protein
VTRYLTLNSLKSARWHQSEIQPEVWQDKSLISPAFKSYPEEWQNMPLHPSRSVTWHEISLYLQMCGKSPTFKSTQKYDKDTSYDLARSTTRHQSLNLLGSVRLKLTQKCDMTPTSKVLQTSGAGLSVSTRGLGRLQQFMTTVALPTSFTILSATLITYNKI